MHLLEAIVEMNKTNMKCLLRISISNGKQCYRNNVKILRIHICAAIKIDSIPIRIHLLFKALDKYFLPGDIDHMHHYHKKISDNYRILHRLPKLGWENFNVLSDFHVIHVVGNHHTMMTNPENRSSL